MTKKAAVLSFSELLGTLLTACSQQQFRKNLPVPACVTFFNKIHSIVHVKKLKYSIHTINNVSMTQDKQMSY